MTRSADRSKGVLEGHRMDASVRTLQGGDNMSDSLVLLVAGITFLLGVFVGDAIHIFF